MDDREDNVKDDREDRTKFELTDEMRKRLRELHKQHGKSAGSMASQLKVSKDSYKNLIGEKRRVKTIRREILYKLSDIYECSYDYLRCLSNDPNLNRYGKKATHPLIWPLDRMVEAVSRYLYNDPRTLESIYILTCLLNEDDRKKMLDTMNFVFETLRTGLLLDREDKMDTTQLEYLKKALHYDDIDYTCALNHMSEGDEYVKKGIKYYKNALDHYLHVVYIEMTLSPWGKTNRLRVLTPDQIKPLGDEARKKICSLRKAWGAFPDSISPVVDTFECSETVTDKDNLLGKEQIIAVIEKRLKIPKKVNIEQKESTDEENIEPKDSVGKEDTESKDSVGEEDAEANMPGEVLK